MIDDDPAVAETLRVGLTLETSVPSTPVVIRGDASQITRAMDNMLDNACKFTPARGRVRVALSEHEGKAEFSVTDSGIGISSDDMPQVFNRFHRGRNTNAYAGSGLGLAIVRAILSGHGGTIAVHSGGEGQGSRFSIVLPTTTVDN